MTATDPKRTWWLPNRQRGFQRLGAGAPGVGVFDLPEWVLVNYSHAVAMKAREDGAMSPTRTTLEATTHQQFEKAVGEKRYLKGRWEYYCETIEMARRLNPKSILEVGPGPLHLFPSADSLDRAKKHNPTYQHDATIVPWPIADKAYDLIIASQVFEHFNGRQREAFAELRRCCRYGLVSIPYKWKTSKRDDHIGLTDETMKSWTGGAEPIAVSVVPKQSSVKRLRRSAKLRKIYLYDFG